MTENQDRMFTKPQEVSEKDTFSNLNYDCLLHVFSFLDRESLDVMQCVSQKMNNIANSKKCRKIKRQVCSLTIVQNDSSTHSFYLNGYEDDSTCLVCDVETTEDTVNVVRRSFVGQYNDIDLINDNADSSFVPDELVDNVFKVCEKNRFSFLIFKNIHFDNLFLEECFDIIKRNWVRRMEFHSLTFDAELDWKRFRKFFLWSGVQQLTFLPLTAKFEEMLDEGFLRRFSSNARGQYLALRTRITESSNHFWNVSSDFLPVICRFYSLTQPPMVLTSDRFLELITMRFQLPFLQLEEVLWKFRVSQIVTLDQLQMISQKPEFEVEFENWEEDGKASIRMRGCAFFCKLLEFEEFFNGIDMLARFEQDN